MNGLVFLRLQRHHPSCARLGLGLGSGPGLGLGSGLLLLGPPRHRPRCRCCGRVALRCPPLVSQQEITVVPARLLLQRQWRRLLRLLRLPLPLPLPLLKRRKRRQHRVHLVALICWVHRRSGCCRLAVLRSPGDLGLWVVFAPACRGGSSSPSCTLGLLCLQPGRCHA